MWLFTVQTQKLQMRVGGIQSRLVQVPQNQQIPPGLAVGPRIGPPTQPPPPPPYPGPPPPYPGNKPPQQQQGVHHNPQQVRFLVCLILFYMFFSLWLACGSFTFLSTRFKKKNTGKMQFI